METAGAQTGRKASFLNRWLLGKRALALFCAIAVSWVVGCGILYSEMRKPPELFGSFMTRVPAPVAFVVLPFETLWMHARAGALNVGDRAPDFTLTTLDHSGQVQLSALNRSQPVVLVFGSYT